MIAREDRTFEDSLFDTWRRLCGRRMMAGCIAQEVPLAILVTGQPGAGKSVAATGFRTLLRSQGGAVMIDPTELAILHPAQVVSRRDGSEQNEFLREESGRCAVEILESAVNRRYHLIVNCLFQCPDSARPLVDYLRLAGYTILIHGLVVNPDLTRHRIELRRQSHRLCQHPVRYDGDHHDQMCVRLQVAMEWLGASSDWKTLLLWDEQDNEWIERDKPDPEVVNRLYLRLGNTGIHAADIARDSADSHQEPGNVDSQDDAHPLAVAHEARTRRAEDHRRSHPAGVNDAESRTAQRRQKWIDTIRRLADLESNIQF